MYLKLIIQGLRHFSNITKRQYNKWKDFGRETKFPTGYYFFHCWLYWHMTEISNRVFSLAKLEKSNFILKRKKILIKGNGKLSFINNF